jgi:diaminohydroxyphosphoribosylaminopyrimidine deaminase/5-amino-6-(5-phosphoribosylamino)uracil reductase
MTHNSFMRRCIELAKLGAGYVAPNPMVGAVLVHDSKIIGEGYHQKYGEGHAEVNCLRSVKEEDRHKIPNSVLYVSLEPCAHIGKTPPCADLVIANKIPEVIIGSLDPFSEVNGKGVEKLKAAGIKVTVEVLANECKELNKRFFTFHRQHRPYIILKWAETANKKISSGTDERLFISNENTNRLVHKWRSEEAAILVGTNTALHDDPELTNRNWYGPSPIRLVIDMDLKLPATLRLFNDKQRTVIFNKIRHQESDKLFYYQVTDDVSLVHQIINALHRMKIQSVLVEGGARLLQSFIDERMWDEIRVIKNEELRINNGLNAPEMSMAELKEESRVLNDSIKIYTNGLG